VWDLIAFADQHGVLPILTRLSEVADEACPTRYQMQLRSRAATDVAADLIREHELKRLIGACHSSAVTILLMKGADLAYSRYERPDLRPRTDTDVLVAWDDRARASELLTSCGYERVAQSGGDLLMYQEPFRLWRDGAVVHVVDLHWRVFNPQRFGAVFGFDELLREAEPRPSLGGHARGLGVVHALMLACVHRTAHHFNDDRLIWLVDIQALVAAMTPERWHQLLKLSAERSVQSACVSGLEEAARALKADVPAEVLQALRDGAAGEELASPYRDAGVPHVMRVISDLRLLPAWSARVRLARQHLFPPVAYMRKVYGASSRTPLPLLYVTRIVKGARRWLSRS
jgi:hypothetical protein